MDNYKKCLSVFTNEIFNIFAPVNLSFYIPNILLSCPFVLKKTLWVKCRFL
jgi:hypothetical protein